ncbi:MAG: hypothetical protein HY938_00225 [Nitrosomonadales bacterium]|nr:hypothetical protein [Nitrosomonadales bacterium]
MVNFTNLTGLIGVAVAMAAALLLAPGITRFPWSRRAVLAGVFFVLALIPFGGMPIAAYLRGVTGDLSITTLVLLWCALLSGLRNPAIVSAEPVESRGLPMLIAIVAMFFYPLSLGIGMFDPYRPGYGDPVLIAALLLIALAAWFRKSALITLCIALAVLAWSLGWYESANLWDYLLDPFMAIYSLCALVLQAVRIAMRARGARM